MVLAPNYPYCQFKECLSIIFPFFIENKIICSLWKCLCNCVFHFYSNHSHMLKPISYAILSTLSFVPVVIIVTVRGSSMSQRMGWCYHNGCTIKKYTQIIQPLLVTMYISPSWLLLIKLILISLYPIWVANSSHNAMMKVFVFFLGVLFCVQ